MSKLNAIPVVFALLIPGVVSAQAPAANSSGDIVIPRCLVTLIDEVNIPAQETGVLRKIPVERGNYVAQGGLLAQIDDSVPTKQHEIAQRKFDKATEQATNDVDIKYAAKAAEVSEAEHLLMVEANKSARGTIAPITIRKAKLQWEKAVLQAEQADMNFKVASMTAAEAQAEMEAAQIVIDRCQITSPVDGIVVQKYRQEGEWVRPGDPLMRVVGLKRLKLDGSLSADKYAPSMVIGKPATVVAMIPSGQVTFEGTVVFASPEIDSNGNFDFSIEVQNRPHENSWLLRPGGVASVTIHAGQPSTIRTNFTGVQN